MKKWGAEDESVLALLQGLQKVSMIRVIQLISLLKILGVLLWPFYIEAGNIGGAIATPDLLALSYVIK